jgi:hypothetical protein
VAQFLSGTGVGNVTGDFVLLTERLERTKKADTDEQ